MFPSVLLDVSSKVEQQSQPSQLGARSVALPATGPQMYSISALPREVDRPCQHRYKSFCFQTVSDPVDGVEWKFRPGLTNQCTIASKEALRIIIWEDGKNNNEWTAVNGTCSTSRWLEESKSKSKPKEENNGFEEGDLPRQQKARQSLY